MKYLLISDYISHLYQKSFYPKNAKTLVVKPIKVASIRDNGKVYDYYYAPMSSPIPTQSIGGFKLRLILTEERYVSNTWNHLMNTIDTNPDMAKDWHYYSWG
ncbi:hypothetical protein E3E38_03485 [Thermococcus sp. 18S1]|uniref:hypothetical protein n=1 Tax=Thermococcus sp. 18S1 TaxID=1638210 RepID=UPI001438CE8A|nr:hypothetical protein [Thermococcus sp. 18S1]NJE30112.1 hypothetical protein [Thermococcus sp. 18S1]